MNKQIDELGRIVVPKGIRTRLGIKPLDELKFEVEDGRIILMKVDDKMKEFIDELKLNKSVNFENDLENKIDLDYIIERLEEIRNER